ncbi:MAG: carboxypeptidase-like regulatory domain-containing protein [Planctomycetota bacterium]|jgi:hypothetical protein|nr:carboxypeptidase-like regulatory domain-containing protein [Planctomycetota bacterium]
MTTRARNLGLLSLALGLPLAVWTLLAGLAGDPPPAVLAAGGAGVAGGVAGALEPGDRPAHAGDARAPDGAEARARRGIDALAGPSTAAEDGGGEAGYDSLLFGRVVTPGGSPVAGARVLLRGSEFWLSLPADLEVVDADWAQAILGESVTDEEGRFFLEDIEPGMLSIAVLAEGFAPLSRGDLRVPEHERFDLGTLSIERGVRLVGKVIDAKGLGVADVQVLRAITPAAGSARLELPGFGAPLTTSGAGGAFRVETLAPGSWHLIFDSPGHRVAEEHGRTAPAGTTRTGLVVRLDGGLAITGSLVGLDTAGAGGVRITARRADEQPMADADRIEGAERYRPRHTLVGPEGAFRIGGLAPGMQYLLSASRPADGEAPGEWRSLDGVEPALALPGPRPVELRYEPASSLRLRVVGAQGAPLTSFVVRAVGGADVSGDGLLEGAGGEPVDEHPDGMVVFDRLQVPGTGGRVTLSVYAPGFADWTSEETLLRPGEERDLGEATLVLAPELVIRVVDGALGTVVSGARVVVVPATEERTLRSLLERERDPSPFGGASYRWACSGENGVARVTTPFTGVCLVGASAAGYLEGEPLRATAVVAGETSASATQLETSENGTPNILELRLMKAARVVVALVDPEGACVKGMPVKHVAGEPSPNRGFLSGTFGPPKHTSDEHGEVVFEELEPGAHTFTAMDAASSGDDPFGLSAAGDWKPDSDAERRVEVGSGDDLRVTLRLPRRGSLRGVVLERGVPLTGARIQLMGIDEEGEAFFLAMMGSLNESPTVRLSSHEGRFLFEGFPAGRYALLVSHPERYHPLRFDVELTARGSERRIELGLATIEGRVVGEDGLPLANLAVRVGVISDQGRLPAADFKMTLTPEEDGGTDYDYEMVNVDGTRTDLDGRFELRGVNPDQALRLTASGDFVLTQRRSLAPLQRDESLAHEDFTMKAAGCLRVRLVAGVAGDRTRYAVKLIPARGKPLNMRQRPGQKRTRRSLAPGMWRAEVHVKGSERPLVTLQVRVVAGETGDVALRLP